MTFCSNSSRPSGTIHKYGHYKEIVEDADFEALDWKLRGCKVSIYCGLVTIATI